MMRKTLLYTAVIIVLFGGQWLFTGNRINGLPPTLEKPTLSGAPADAWLERPPTVIYFWAEWCGICTLMQNTVSEFLQDHAGITIAVRSGNDAEVLAYLHNKALSWPVINDNHGSIAQRYGVEGVPAIFFVNRHGRITLSAVGYTSIVGLQLRTWLADRLPEY